MNKSYLLKILSLLMLLSRVAAADVCDDPLKGQLCFNMRYLRSQIMVLGAQRELMQVNFPYLQTIGEEIQATTQHINEANLLGDQHAEGLRTVQYQAQNLVTDAKTQDPLALNTANSIQKRCATCHNPTTGPDGIGWDKIFKNDWEHISKNCSKEGRNPYVCRSMNGMMSSYLSIFSASKMNRQSFPALLANTQEIQRIAKDLNRKKMIHMSNDMLNDVISRTDDVIRLAEVQNPEAFEKGVGITQACMQCHGEMMVSKADLKISPW